MRFVVRVPVCRDWRMRLTGMPAYCTARGEAMSTLRAQKGRDVSLIPALTDQLFLRDPYPTCRRVTCPGRERLGQPPDVADLGYAETHEALRSPQLSVHTAGARLGQAGPRYAPVVEAVSRFLTRVDGPAHRRLRGLLLAPSPPRRWSRWRTLSARASSNS